MVESARQALPERWPGSLREINDLSEEQKQAIYYTLLPEWLFTRFGIDRRTLTYNGEPVVSLRCPPESRAMEMTVSHQPGARDPVLYLNMVDTANYQLLVLLLVINDPNGPRFDVDVDEQGKPTHLDTQGRNLAEECRAMEYGLAPGQIRPGLRVFRAGVPIFEAFVRNMGHDLFFIEPLAYHNAIAFERYGFSYERGKKDMQEIHEAFQPGGKLHAALDGSTRFHQPNAWKTVRGRSWAIHDGILGHPFSGFQMYKRIGKEAGITTFPDSTW